MLFVGAGLVALANSFALRDARGRRASTSAACACSRLLSLALGGRRAVRAVARASRARASLVARGLGPRAAVGVGRVDRLRHDRPGAERLPGLLHPDLRLARPHPAALDVGVVRAGRRARVRVAHGDDAARRPCRSRASRSRSSRRCSSRRRSRGRWRAAAATPTTSRTLVAASSELREVLNLAEGAALAAASTRAVLHADRVELLRAGIGRGPRRRSLSPSLVDARRRRGRDR